MRPDPCISLLVAVAFVGWAHHAKPASADESDYVEAARLWTTVGMSDAVVVSGLDTPRRNLAKCYPNRVAEIDEIIATVFLPEVRKHLADIVPATAKKMAGIFTDAEIRQLVNFLEQPVAASYFEATFELGKASYSYDLGPYLAALSPAERQIVVGFIESDAQQKLDDGSVELSGFLRELSLMPAFFTTSFALERRGFELGGC